jgi:5-methylcytosine-specific restriction endonuclease McrA
MGKHASYKGIWTEEEIQYLKDNWEKTLREKMAAYLGRSLKAVTKKLDSFIGKPCQCGIVCEGNTIITYENSHIDHIIPLVEAKTEEDVIKLNQIENLQRICDKCNLSKSDYLPEELEKYKNK